MGKASAFRFVSSRRAGQYSVWRGDVPLGHVTKIEHRIHDHGALRSSVTGWRPSTPAGLDLAAARTRVAAALALWALRL